MITVQFINNSYRNLGNSNTDYIINALLILDDFK